MPQIAGLNFLKRDARKPQPKLMLLLHGYGSNEADLFSFSDEIPGEFIVLSLQAPHVLPFGGYAWYGLDFLTDGTKWMDEKQAETSKQQIKQFALEAANHYACPTDDIWLCGFSQGAILSYALTLENPAVFKHGLLLSGYPEEKLFTPKSVEELQNLQLFVSHGTEDMVIPADWARKAKTLKEKYQLQLDFHEYAHMGHGINPNNYHDMMKWMQEKLDSQ